MSECEPSLTDWFMKSLRVLGGAAAIANLLQTLILIAAGAAFGFEMFTNVNFGVLLVVFVTFAIRYPPPRKKNRRQVWWCFP